MNQPQIITNALTKRFGKFTALDQCDLTINQGEVFGLLGPNGAGKSTLIRLLVGFLHPSEGSATIDGADCWAEKIAVHRIVSYLPGDARLNRMIRARNLLKMFCEFRSDANYEKAVGIADRFELDLNRWVGLMSTGTRQKLAMTICLAAETPILILDEPTANLDPTVRGRILELVLEAKRQGRTVVFSSHVLSEIEEVCDQVAILRRGKLVHKVPISQVKMQHRIRAHLRGELPEIPDALKPLISVNQNGDTVLIETPQELSGVLKWLADAPLADVHIQPIGLRSVYDRFHYDAPADVEDES